MGRRDSVYMSGCHAGTQSGTHGHMGGTLRRKNTGLCGLWLWPHPPRCHKHICINSGLHLDHRRLFCAAATSDPGDLASLPLVPLRSHLPCQGQVAHGGHGAHGAHSAVRLTSRSVPGRWIAVHTCK